MNMKSPHKRNQLSRGGAVVARRAHNPEVAGSNPVPAKKLYEKAESSDSAFFVVFFIVLDYFTADFG